VKEKEKFSQEGLDMNSANQTNPRLGFRLEKHCV
jgi:hypothetical protein